MSNTGARVTLGVVPRERWSLSVRSLTSLLKHTPSDVELIYVDGGSPDHIRRELESMVSSRGGRFIRHDYVMATNEARNIIVDWFTNSLTFEDHCAVGPDNQSRLHTSGNGLGFFSRQPLDHFLGRFSGNRVFRNIGGRNGEFQSQGRHQLESAR